MCQPRKAIHLCPVNSTRWQHQFQVEHKVFCDHTGYVITPNLHHQRWEMLWHFLQDKEPANAILHLKDSYFARKKINSKHRFQILWERQAQSIRVPHFNATSEKGDYDFHIKLRHFTHGQEMLSALKGMDHHLVEQPFLLLWLLLRKTGILTKVQRDGINNSSKFKTVFSPASNPDRFPYCCHKAVFFRIPKGSSILHCPSFWVLCVSSFLFEL